MSSVLDVLRPAFDSHFAKTVVFRVFTRSDGWPLWDATQHPQFNKNLLWRAPLTQEEMFQQVDKLVREHVLGRALVLSICHRPTGAWQGLLKVRPFRDGVEASFYLHPDVWGRGLAVTAGPAFTQVIFDRLPDLPIYVRVMPTNDRQLHLCRFYRFERLDTEYEDHPQEGRKELQVWRLDRERWATYRHVTAF